LVTETLRAVVAEAVRVLRVVHPVAAQEHHHPSLALRSHTLAVAVEQDIRVEVAQAAVVLVAVVQVPILKQQQEQRHLAVVAEEAGFTAEVLEAVVALGLS
jgi:hypothetical protein